MFHFTITLKLLLLLFVGLIVHAENPCRIPIGSIHYNRIQWPLVYTLSGELYATSRDAENNLQVLVPAGAEVILSCGPNYLKQYAFKKQKTLNVKCQGESGKFSVSAGQEGINDAGKVKDVEEFACDLRVIEEQLALVAGCNKKEWTAVAFGYEQPFEKVTHILGNACYDSGKGQTRKVQIQLLKNETISYMRKLPMNYLNTQRHPDQRYKVELFRGLFFDEIYQRIREKLHVNQAPGLHMAHYLDASLLGNEQLRSVEKLGWNYFVAHDNLDEWQQLKEDVRRLSEGQNVIVHIGSHGVQELYGPNGEKMKLYLQPAAGEEGRFPMPQLLWLVVHPEESNEWHSFVVYNEAANAVNSGGERRGDAICKKSQCEHIDWLSDELKTGAGGKLICCDYQEFKKVVEEAI